MLVWQHFMILVGRLGQLLHRVSSRGRPSESKHPSRLRFLQKKPHNFMSQKFFDPQKLKNKGFIITDHNYRNVIDISSRIVLMRDGATKTSPAGVAGIYIVIKHQLSSLRWTDQILWWRKKKKKKKKKDTTDVCIVHTYKNALSLLIYLEKKPLI